MKKEKGKRIKEKGKRKKEKGKRKKGRKEKRQLRLSLEYFAFSCKDGKLGRRTGKKKLKETMRSGEKGEGGEDLF